MKRPTHLLAGLFIVALAAVAASPSQATQTGGLAWPVGQGGFAMSVTLAYVDQSLKNGDADGASSFRNLLRAEVGLFDDFDLYGTVGISDMKLRGDDFEESRGGSLAGGARYSLVKSGDGSLRLVLNLGGEYFKISDVTKLEYEAGVYVVKQYGAAGKVGFFYPFGGVRVSNAQYDGTNGVEDYKGKNFIGFLAGADYFVSPNVYFSGEVHLFDEMSVYLTTGYRF